MNTELLLLDETHLNVVERAFKVRTLTKCAYEESSTECRSYIRQC